MCSTRRLILVASFVYIGSNYCLAAVSSAPARPCLSALPQQLLSISDQRGTRSAALKSLPILALRGGASATTAETPAWINICGKLAPMMSVATFMAPIPTVQTIATEKTVADLPLLPYSSLVANASVWLLYGILLGEAKVWSCNAAGFALGLYYFATFARFSPSESPTLPGSISSHLRASAAVVACAAAVAWSVPRPTAIALLGKAGVAICVGLFASPLAALKTVVATKSADSIPLPFALATTINCALWSIVGVLDMKDVNVALPNILGLTFGTVQIILKLLYGFNKG